MYVRLCKYLYCLIYLHRVTDSVPICRDIPGRDRQEAGGHKTGMMYVELGCVILLVFLMIDDTELLHSIGSSQVQDLIDYECGTFF